MMRMKIPLDINNIINYEGGWGFNLMGGGGEKGEGHVGDDRICFWDWRVERDEKGEIWIQCGKSGVPGFENLFFLMLGKLYLEYCINSKTIENYIRNYS